MAVHEIISDTSDRYIELVNRDSDPVMWIVQLSKKLLFFKIKKRVWWFADSTQARDFAQQIKTGAIPA
jgi:hypothetical protein